MFKLSAIPSKDGKIALVTGANNGLGYQTTLGLAKKDILVIMACRNLEKANIAKNRILKEVPKAKLVIMQVDLRSLASVKTFAAAFIKEYKQLDYLIENAGIMIPPFQQTEDGFESQMAVNYFGHFALTQLLLPLLNTTPNARVVTLSSKAHENGRINFKNLNAEKSYKPMVAYSQSKLACLMFAFELQRRFEANKLTTIAVSAHPGVSPTNLFKHLPIWLRVLTFPFIPLTHKPKNAALPILYAALGTDINGGEYCGPTGFKGLSGAPGKVTAQLHAYDEEVSAKLWEVSEELTKVIL